MIERLIRNIPAISEEQQKILSTKTVAVIGCGGLGGFVLEYLIRAGVNNIVAVDGDVFSESNLNRQILSTLDNMGRNKASAAKERASKINPDANITAIDEFLTEENADLILKNADIAIDAMDTGQGRIMLSDLCAMYNIPMIHGAVHSWMAQVSSILPGDKLMHILYDGKNSSEENASNVSFVPAICAGVEVAEAVKLLIGEPVQLCKKLLIMDFKTMDFRTIDFSSSGEDNV